MFILLLNCFSLSLTFQFTNLLFLFCIYFFFLHFISFYLSFPLLFFNLFILTSFFLLHRQCKKCLEGVASLSTDPSSFACPICRYAHPSRVLVRMRPNSTLVRLIDKFGLEGVTEVVVKSIHIPPLHSAPDVCASCIGKVRFVVFCIVWFPFRFSCLCLDHFHHIFCENSVLNVSVAYLLTSDPHFILHISNDLQLCTKCLSVRYKIREREKKALENKQDSASQIERQLSFIQKTALQSARRLTRQTRRSLNATRVVLDTFTTGTVNPYLSQVKQTVLSKLWGSSGYEQPPPHPALGRRNSGQGD